MKAKLIGGGIRAKLIAKDVLPGALAHLALHNCSIENASKVVGCWLVCKFNQLRDLGIGLRIEIVFNFKLHRPKRIIDE